MAIFNLENNVLSVKVNSFGAELCSVFSKETNIEYIWQADEVVWARHAPNLFPIVGKLKDGEFIYQSKSYQLSQHGFARDREFICIEQKDDYFLFELTANEETLTKFPFHFSFQIKYKLLRNKLEISYSVFNPDNCDLYFSVGAHPAFNCPLQLDESFNDYDLVFPYKESLIINKLNDGLIASETNSIDLIHHKLSVSKQLFENDALVFMNSQFDEVHLISKKTNHGVALTSKNWPYFGIWTKKNTEQFICLEPWHGIADSVDTNKNILEKTGIIKLESNCRFNASFTISFF
jgi:galactose mutarotase-like enzyme